MSPVSSVNNTSSSTATSARSQMALTLEDFMKVMITELTNQDPFEPMTNKELLEQMSTMQQMQSSMDMTNSFEDMMGRMDTMMMREELGSASRMLDTFISGTSLSGVDVYGQVKGVNINNGEVVLELDNGYLVNIADVHTLGGNGSQDIIGSIVMGRNENGNYLVGKVESLEVTDGAVRLNLESGRSLLAIDATKLNEDNASLLLGQKVQAVIPGGDNGTDQNVEGHIVSVKLNADGVIVQLDDASNTEVPLEYLTEIIPVSSTPNA